MTKNQSLLENLKKSSSRRYTVQLFDDLNTSAPTTLNLTESEFVELLSSYEELERKSDVPLFNTTQFASNDRQLENAKLIDCLILDLDGKYYSYSPKEIERMFSEYRFFAYESYSSNGLFDKWRWRVVLPFEKPVSPEQYTATIQAITQKWRLDVDKVTAQPNAIFYLPSCPVGDKENRVVLSGNGNYLSPEQTALKATSKTVSVVEQERVNPTLNTDIRLSKLKTLNGYEIPEIKKSALTLSELKAITCMPCVGLALASLVGIDVTKCGLFKGSGRYKSKALTSVLPWHEKDRSPSTGLLIKSHGEYAGKVIYRSFKDSDADNPIFDLHYVYACQVIGKRIPVERWTKSTSQIWLVRALADAGILTLPKMNFVSLPQSCSKGSVQLYESMKLLVRVRAALDIYSDDAVIFSFQFAEVWSGMTRQTASKHFDTLIREGIVEQEWVETPRLKCNGFIPRFVRTVQSESSSRSLERMVPDQSKSLLEQIVQVIKHYQSDGRRLPIQFVASQFPIDRRTEVIDSLPLLRNYIDIGSMPDKKNRRITAYAQTVID